MSHLFRDTARAMAQENVEIVRSAFEAFERGDVEGILRCCDENIEITQDAELFDLLGASPRQHGHEGVLKAFAVWPDQWEDFSIEILSVRAVGDRVMVTTVNRGRGKDSGIDVEMPFTFLFSVRAGAITEWRIFMREAEALKAAGGADDEK
jgi:ketosteroid isomerase-like protein